MRIVVIEGTGPIGDGLVAALRRNGHDAVMAPPCFDRFTGEGLAAVLRGAAVVVDLADARGVDTREGVERFAAATKMLLEFEVAAAVEHHVALTPVSIERLLDSHYFRARLAEEQLIRRSAIPYSLIRATPLFESLSALADDATHGSSVHVPPALVQPVAAADVVRLLAAIAGGAPLNRTIEIGGPEPFYLAALVQRVLGSKHDERHVTTDPSTPFLGAHLDERSLLAGDEAELGEVRFDDWLRETTEHRGAADSGPSAQRAPNRREFRVSDVAPGSALLLGDVAVFSVAGGFCATQAYCTHRAGPLSEGAIDDSTVTCPLHGAQFNVWTGAVLRGPAEKPLKTYRVTVDGDVGRVVGDERGTVLPQSVPSDPPARDLAIL